MVTDCRVLPASSSANPKSANANTLAVSSFVVTVALAAVGASLTATPVKVLLPVIAGATPSEMLVAMVKLPL